jgi:hypothetical protein
MSWIDLIVDWLEELTSSTTEARAEIDPDG